MLKASAGGDTDEAKRAIKQLCEMYWQTLYRIARKTGRNDDDACDAVQGFLCRMLEGKFSLRLAAPERGRFRSFLWVCFRGYLIDEYRASTRRKVGGDVLNWSFDSRGQDGKYLLEPVEYLTPEDAFRKSIALDTFQAAFEELRAIWARKGQAEKFRHLQDYLVEECRGSKARTLGELLGVSDIRARVTVSELRAEFGRILRQRIADLLANPTEYEIECELDWLWQSLCL